MKKMTAKELDIMKILWEKGPLSMRGIYEEVKEPRPHFNTISTMIHRMEQHGLIEHEAPGVRFFLYKAKVSYDDYVNSAQSEAVDSLFGGSYMGFISHLVEREKISIEDLKELIKMVEEG